MNLLHFVAMVSKSCTCILWSGLSCLIKYNKANVEIKIITLELSKHVSQIKEVDYGDVSMYVIMTRQFSGLFHCNNMKVEMK